ncbi:hypothetical protein ASE99_23460 [Serratia sp. Leaf51]|nr:hypothetical protein ASE99_23460 [Serratia sp. Leaf51]
MHLIKLISTLSTVFSVLNGAIVIGNDVLFGIRTSLPVISSVAGMLFLLNGFLIWQMGSSLSRLRSWLMREGIIVYKRLSLCLSVAMTTYGLLMLAVMYGLLERIAQGYSIFG